jgi:hypothetical protein
MEPLIIYPQENQSIAIISPSLDCGLTVEEIAAKDTPEGVPYLLVTADDLPPDHKFAMAWEADFSKPDGYGVGHKNWFASRGITI